MGIGWYFQRQRPGFDPHNPLGGEHFNAASGGDSDWEPGESLVREAIQNSLDAARPGEPVHIRFHVGPKPMPAETAVHWFGTLWPHLCAAGCLYSKRNAVPNSGGYLVVEDFGTRGLEGDPAQWNIPREQERNDFFHFCRAEGLSGKGAGSGGSWGVGKSVFSRTSKIHSFLLATIRHDDGRALIFGKSILRHHYQGDVEFCAIGNLGLPGALEGWPILPCDDQAVRSRLAKDFDLLRDIGPRADRDASGLSIIVPYPDPEITASALLRIVVREYFEPILTGRLTVSVSGPGLPRGARSVQLGEESIVDQARELGKPELVRMLHLAKWARTEGQNRCVPLAFGPAESAPDWTHFKPDEVHVFGDLCGKFAQGEPIAFRVPVRVQPTDGESTESYFDVFVQRDLHGTGYSPMFVRAGLVVPNVRPNKLQNHQLLAFIAIDDEPLATMLRAAEPPSHTKWEHGTAHFRDRYEYGRQTIEFVVASPKALADALAGASQERDVLALADIFPEPDDEGVEQPTGRKRKKRKTDDEVVDPPAPRPRPFRIEDKPGGFVVHRANADQTALPEQLIIRAAYETSRGDAMKKYHPADFSFKALKPHVTGAQVMECEANVMVITPQSDDFRIEVGGFDVNRDLLVKVSAVNDTEEVES